MATTSSNGHSRAEQVLEGLSDAQRAAASYTDGPLIIVAGPGSGKTRVMSHRMAYIIASGVPPWRALGVTFTNKAAGELLSRCERLAAQFMPGSERPHVSTFHSWGARFLRQHAELVGLRSEFTIYDRDDQLQLMKRIISDTQYDHAASAIINEIGRAKNDNVDPDLYASQSADRYHEQQADLYALYQQALSRANAVDFDDLLMLPCRALGEHREIRERLQQRYLHLMVDEFQDTNALQFELVKLLGAVHQNVCVVGDPDQSIYSWRNARPENMNTFRTTFEGAKVFELNESYRSTQNIISAADSLIGHNDRHFARTLFTNNAEGSKIRVVAASSPEHEATLVLNRYRDLAAADATCDAAVLYRTNAQSRVMETECNLRGMPYRLIGGTRFYERREIKDALALLKIVVNPTDEVSLRRIVNVPPRGIGSVTLQKLEEYALNNRMPLMEAVLDTNDPLKTGATGLRGRALRAVASFAGFVGQLIANSANLSTYELLEFALRGSGYLEWLNKEPETALERKQNLDELQSVAHQYGGGGSRRTDASAQDHADALQQFLEHTALFTNLDRDDFADTSAERPISLITLHQAKGLEFDAVFIIGANESLLPHQLALENNAGRNGQRSETEEDGRRTGGGGTESAGRRGFDMRALMEERRLMYVGMTRAKTHLQISHSDYSTWGASLRRSRFISEIAPQYVDVHGDRGVTSSAGRGYSGYGYGERERNSGSVGSRANGGPVGTTYRPRPSSRPAAPPRTTRGRERTATDDRAGWFDSDSDGAPPTRFQPGDRVTHPHFGDGVVINCRESAGDMVLNVAFADKQAGVKQLVASMANLTHVARSPDGSAAGDGGADGASTDTDDGGPGDAAADDEVTFDD